MRLFLCPYFEIAVFPRLMLGVGYYEENEPYPALLGLFFLCFQLSIFMERVEIE